MGCFFVVLSVLADLLGLSWAYVFGAYVIGQGILWPQYGGVVKFLHGIPGLLPHMPLAWQHALLGVSLVHIGLFWVALYLTGRLWAVVHAFIGFLQARAKLGKPAPGGEIEEVVKECYRDYEIFTARAAYPPLEFRTPPTFRYRPGAMGMEIGWIGLVLVIDSSLLKSWQLAPRLAREVGHYNSLDRYYHLIIGPQQPLWKLPATLFGFGWCLPTLVKHYVWCFYWRRRVFDKDAFAVLLGQGSTLLRVLEFDRPLQTDRGFFRNMPYIEERIDRVKALIARQQRLQPRPKQQTIP